MKSLRFYFLLFLFAVLCNTSSAELSQSQLDEFKEFAAEQMKRDKVPAMTIGFKRWGDGEDITWVEAFGYSDLENQVPAKPDSAYRLGSVSKPMTAIAVLQLVEQGKIDLDAEVQTYVPYFPKKNWPITVRQLLAHTGGISHYKDYQVEGRIKEKKSTREAIAIFENFDLVAEPGTKYSYSSYGYNLLGAIVEGASGVSFGEFMRKNIWDPLEMQNTRMDDATDLISNRVRGYRIMNGEIKNSEFVDISSRFGAGGKRSTVPDLLKFAKGVVEGKLLSPKSLELVYSSMTTKDGRYVDYTAGWGVRTLNGHYMIRHTGSQQETATILMCFPALKLAIACAINQEDAGATVFANRLYEILTNERLGLNAYVTEDEDTYQAMTLVFSSGLAYFELKGAPFTSDEEQITKSFDYFIRSTEKANAKLIGEGYHPVAGEPYKTLGSYMAELLSYEHGINHLKTYHISGAIPFFTDYLELCKDKKELSFACRFPDRFQKLVTKWDESWEKANTTEIRSLRLNVDMNLSEVEGLLRKSFTNRSAYPDYSREFSDVTWELLADGNQAKSLRTGEIGTLFYSGSPRHLAIYGMVLVAASDKNRGISYLKKAYQMDPESPAEPEWISDFAEAMAEAGKVQEAFKIMEAALEIHPTHSQLHTDMGEAYMMMENKAKAEVYFQKALELDPKNDRAKAMLEKLKP